MGHKLSDREQELVNHDLYDAFLNDTKEFIKAFFKTNYSMLFTDMDFSKNLIKKAQKNSVIFDPNSLNHKTHKINKITRVYNSYSEAKLNKALDLL